jgi:hypothetical protein
MLSSLMGFFGAFHRGALNVPTKRPQAWPFESWEPPSHEIVSARNTALWSALQLGADFVKTFATKLPEEKVPNIIFGFSASMDFDLKAANVNGTFYVACSLITYYRVICLFYILGSHPDIFLEAKRDEVKMTLLNLAFSTTCAISREALTDGDLFYNVSLLNSGFKVVTELYDKDFHQMAYDGTLCFLLFALLHELNHIFAHHFGILRKERMTSAKTQDARSAFEFCADYHALHGVYVWILNARNDRQGQSKPKINYDAAETISRSFGFCLGTFFLLKELEQRDIVKSTYPKPAERLRTLAAMQIVDCIKGDNWAHDSLNIIKNSILKGISDAYRVVRDLSGGALYDQGLSDLQLTKYNCLICNASLQSIVDLSQRFRVLIAENQDLLNSYALTRMSSAPDIDSLEQLLRVDKNSTCRMPG